jgi:hypothetical protein
LLLVIKTFMDLEDNGINHKDLLISLKNLVSVSDEQTLNQVCQAH